MARVDPAGNFGLANGTSIPQDQNSPLPAGVGGPNGATGNGKKSLSKHELHVIHQKHIIRAAKIKAAKSASKGNSGGGSRNTGGGSKSTSSSASGSKTSTTTKSTKTSSSKGSTNTLAQQAKNAIAAQLDPKINAIKSQQSIYDKAAAAAQQKNLNRTTQGQHDLGLLYQKLDSQLANQQGQTNSAYAGAASAVDQNYANLLSSLADMGSKSAQQISGEAARLGLTQDTNNAAQDNNFAQQLASTNRQNAATMIAAQGQNAAQTGEFIRQAEQGLGTQTSADYKTSQDKALNDLILQQQSQDSAFGSQVANLEGQRAGMEQTYLQQLEQQAYDRAMEAQQQAFMNQLALNKYNLSADKFTADQAYRAAQLQLQQQQISIAAQKAAGGGKSTTYDRSGAYTVLNSVPDAHTKSVLNEVFTVAMQAGEFDFNNTADREKAINAMRAWLAKNASDMNTATNMQYLINAYDVYHGTKYIDPAGTSTGPSK